MGKICNVLIENGPIVEDGRWDADTVPVTWLADHWLLTKEASFITSQNLPGYLVHYTGYVTVFTFLHKISFLLAVLHLIENTSWSTDLHSFFTILVLFIITVSLLEGK